MGVELATSEENPHEFKWRDADSGSYYSRLLHVSGNASAGAVVYNPFTRLD